MTRILSLVCLFTLSASPVFVSEGTTEALPPPSAQTEATASPESPSGTSADSAPAKGNAPLPTPSPYPTGAMEALEAYIHASLDAYGRADAETRFRLALAFDEYTDGNPLLILREAEAIPLQELPDATSGIDRLRALHKDTTHSPEVRDRASAMLIRRLYAAGETEAAHALEVSRGWIRHWRLIGPFGARGSGDFYETFPPETDPVLKGTVPALGRPADWQTIPPAEAIPAIRPWDWTRPGRGVVYLVTQVHVEEGRVALLEIETACPYAVRVNGGRFEVTDHFRQEWPLRRRFRIPLSQGWNRILVKLAYNGGETDLRARLLDPHGTPLADITYEAGDTWHLLPPRVPGEEIRPAPSAEAEAEEPWLATSSTEPPDPEGGVMTLRSFAQALAAMRSGMPDAAVGGRILPSLPEESGLSIRQQAALLAWQGDLAMEASSFPEAMRRSLARRAYAQAVELDPTCTAGHLGLGRIAVTRGALREAEASFRAAVKANPDSLEALLERLKLVLLEDWSAEASAIRDQILARAPESIAAALAQANVAHHLRRLEEAAEAERRLLAFALRDDWLRRQAAHTLLQAGKAEEAVTLLEEGLRERPDAILLLRTLGEVYLRMGRAEEAEKTLGRALAWVPRDADLHRIAGDALYLLDRPEEAVRAYEASLALVPGQPALRRLVCELTDRDFAFWKPYMLDTMEALRDFRALRNKPQGKTARIIDHSIVEVQPDGSFVSYTHDLVQILNPSGIQDAANLQIRGEILRARTIQPNGQTRVPVYLPDQYTLTMPALSVGSATEHMYLWYQPPPYDLSAQIPKWYFRSPNMEEAFLLSLYMIRVPHGVPFVYEGRNLGDEVTYERRETTDATVHIWTARDMPRALHEEGSPEVDERLPFIDAGAPRDWTHINQLYLGMLTGRVRQSHAIRERARRYGGTDSERVQALHRFVCQMIEPSSVDVPAAHILQQGYGNRAVLLLALLEAAGIPAWYAPTRSPEPILHAPNWSIPKMEQFPIPMVVAEVDGGRIWLDTRHRYLQAGTLLEDVAGGTALRIDHEGGGFLSVPPAAPTDFQARLSLTLQLDDPTRSPGGRVTAGSIHLRGTEGEEEKEFLVHATALARHKRLEERIAAFLPGLELRETDPGPERPGHPSRDGALQLAFEADVPVLSEAYTDGRFATRLTFPPPPLMPNDDQVPEDRQTPYILGTYHVAQDTIRYQLPPGHAVVRVPDPVRLRTPFGSYLLLAEQKGTEVHVRREYTFLPQRISLEAWPDFVSMVRTIGRAEREAFLWQREDPRMAVPEGREPSSDGTGAGGGR